MRIKDKSGTVSASGTTSGLSGLFALLGGVCCWGPLFFSIAGITAGTGGALGSTAFFLEDIVPYRNYFLILNISGLLLSFYLIYVMPKMSFKKGASCTGAGLNGKACNGKIKTKGSFNWNKAVFFLSVALTAVIFIYLQKDSGTVFLPYWPM